MNNTSITYSLASVNMRCRNAAMHTLLETNDIDDIIFIQEPWFRLVSVARSDTHLNGEDVLGGVAHPAWLSLHPHYSTNTHTKVITYVRKFSCQHPTRPTALHVAPRNDLIAHPSIQLLEIRAHRIHFRVLNFYNDVADLTALSALLHYQFNDSIPHILLGDFNLHSRSWSPSTWAPSPHVSDLEEQLADCGFTLCNQPGTPTRCGLASE